MNPVESVAAVEVNNWKLYYDSRQTETVLDMVKSRYKDTH